jgi:N-sulfoglucosamine sulfohydrolase
MTRLALFSLLSLTLTAVAAATPNIVFILSDDHSYPNLGCYGNADVKTPHFDRFASEGMKFSRMFTSAPQCVPSRATFMTGRSPVAARMTRFSAPLPRDEITFPELLKQQAGYYVGVLGRIYHLDGAARGLPVNERTFTENKLQTFHERFDYVDASGQDNIPETLTSFFDQRPKDKPYFLWVNFSDPHHPWTSEGEKPVDPATVKVPGFMPDLPGVREDYARYLNEIEHMDGVFQRVLEMIEARAGLDNTLIVFTGDNGMAFPSGKGSLHDPGLHVPLLVWWRGVIKPGGESANLISGEDVAPTCLEAAGVKVPERITGKSFLPLLRGESFQKREFIFAERGPHGSAAVMSPDVAASSVDYSRCVRSERYKLIYNVTPSHRYLPVDSAGGPSWKDIVKAHETGALDSSFATFWFTNPRPVIELYDLQSDPYELRNLAGQPEMKDVEYALKEALQEKMILDFDYLPLPLAPEPRKKPAAPKADNSRASQFKQKDKDNSAALSWEEFSEGRAKEDAAAWFKARDQDKDGVISRAEYLTSDVPNAPR